MQHSTVEPLAHELDAAWLIALWLAIHGGDPAQSEGDVAAAAGQMIAALSSYAFGSAPAVSVDEIRARLAHLNVNVGGRAQGSERGAAPEFRISNRNGVRVVDVDGIEIILPGGGPQILR
jgi:hypothetical protein